MLLSRVVWTGALVFALGCSNVSPDGSTPGDDVPDGGVVVPPEVGTTMYVHTRDTLYTLDDVSFELSAVGEFAIEENITDLAITPDGRIFGISSEALYQVNPANASATFIADVPGELNVGLTFLPNGQLLATDKEGGVREVSPDTGVVTEIGKFGGGWGTAGDLVAVADGTMYAIGEEQDEQQGASDLLLIVNTQSGSASYVGELGHGDVFGTAFAKGKIYAFTSVGEIIQVDPASGTGTLVRTHTDMSFWGAAVTPLVSVE